jgi:hypothetical protein
MIDIGWLLYFVGGKGEGGRGKGEGENLVKGEM